MRSTLFGFLALAASVLAQPAVSDSGASDSAPAAVKTKTHTVVATVTEQVAQATATIVQQIAVDAFNQTVGPACYNAHNNSICITPQQYCLNIHRQSSCVPFEETLTEDQYNNWKLPGLTFDTVAAKLNIDISSIDTESADDITKRSSSAALYKNQKRDHEKRVKMAYKRDSSSRRLNAV